MKKSFFSLMFLILLIINNLNAQQQARVEGVIVDGSSRIVELATISLLNASDSTALKLTTATKNGSFIFDNIAYGKYLVSVTAIGHKKAYSPIFLLDQSNSTVSLAKIILEPEAKTLDNITIASKKPLIEQKPDKTIVNVEASITNAGNNALEVLEKVPGVTVDKDGNVSLKGKQGVQIFVDGKSTYLRGQDLANYLTSLNAAQIEQIEIMSNPPAKYDASGNSGIINIKTKRTKQYGFNGSVTSGITLGKRARFAESFTFNYRKNKINFFSNGGYYHNRRQQELNIYRIFKDKNTYKTLSIFDQYTGMYSQNSYYTGRAGFDFFATKKTTIGATVSAFTNPTLWRSSAKTDIKDATGVLTSMTTAHTQTDSRWGNFSTNFNLRHTIDSAGQEISGDADYLQYNATNYQPLYSSYFDKTGFPTSRPDTLISTRPQHIKIYTAKVDYAKPLSKKAKLEMGLKTSIVNTTNDASYSHMYNGISSFDSSRYTHFNYYENVNAAYINFNQEINKKWSVQAGLRYENANTKGESNGYAPTANGHYTASYSTINRHFNQLFPTAYLQYNFNDKNTYILNYGRRVNRPNYEDLNPFKNYIDRYTYEQGTPNLSAEFSHNLELSHTYNNFLTTKLSASITNDIIQQVLEQDEATNETVIRRMNIAKQKQVDLSISAYKQLTKWWTGNIYSSVNYNRFEGVVNNIPIDIDITMFMIQLQQQFKFNKGWNAEVSGFARSKGVEGVMTIQSMCMVNGGVSKQILKQKATVKLGLNDIFNNSVFRGYARYGNVDTRFQNVNNRRSINLQFTYKFNKGKLKASGSRRDGGAQSEQNRVKMGGN